jgi:hypothetical protein
MSTATRSMPVEVTQPAPADPSQPWLGGTQRPPACHRHGHQPDHRIPGHERDQTDPPGPGSINPTMGGEGKGSTQCRRQNDNPARRVLVGSPRRFLVLGSPGPDLRSAPSPWGVPLPTRQGSKPPTRCYPDRFKDRRRPHSPLTTNFTDRFR